MKILILLLGRIGDMVLTTPAFRVIKEKFPDSTISVIASRPNMTIAQQNIYVDKVILWNNAPQNFFNAFWQIKKYCYDFYIDPKDHYSGTSKFIALNVRAKKKVWFREKESTDINRNINVKFLQQEHYKHFTEKVLVSLAPLGIHYDGKILRPELFETEDSKSYIQLFLEKNAIDEFILLNISAGKNGMAGGRTWQKEKWKQLLEKIANNDIFILINAFNEERIIGEELAAMSNKIFVVRSRNINDVISVVKKASLVITPDTSMVHIAAAFDKPIVALYANWGENTQKFYPTNSIKEVVVAEGANSHITDISLTEVLKAYENLVSRISVNI